MSLRPVNPQRSLFEPDMFLARLFGDPAGPSGRFEFFARNVMPGLEALRPKLEGMYCTTNGRPAEDPVLMLAVSILQFMERLPDRKAAEACVYDLRWKMALGRELDALGFHATSLVKYRQRLERHGLQGLGLEGVLQAMRQAGYLPRHTPQRLDSTHVVGLLSRMSRLECVREAVRLALEALERESSLARPEAWPVWWERYVESQPDWQAPAEALRLKFSQAGADARELLGWVKGLPADWQAPEPVRVLRRVYLENFEENPEGEPAVRRAQPPGAVCNPHEPQAQWSSKPTIAQKEWVGYKVQVAETVTEAPRVGGEPTPNVITAVVTQPATASDKSALPAVEAAWQATGQELPDKLYVDAGYTSGKEFARVQAQGRELQGPAQSAPEPEGRLSSEAFDVRVEERRAVCPAGHSSTQCSRLVKAKTGEVTYRLEWTGVCGSCSLRDRCLGKDQKHRTLTVGEHHTLVQARRREQATTDFQTDMHHRNGIEGTLSELVRGHGLRRARYRGLSKVSLANLMVGAAANCRRWWRRQVWEAEQRRVAQMGCALAEAGS